MGQAMGMSKKGDSTQQVGKTGEDLNSIIEQIYEADLKNKEVEYDDLYHAIFKIIQEIRKKNGAMNYDLPSKEKLEAAFKKYHKSGGKLNKEKCKEIINEVIKFEDVSVGKNATEVLLFLFGFPICAVMAKKVIPGMSSISDDVVIPAATSASVIFLAKTNKL